MSSTASTPGRVRFPDRVARSVAEYDGEGHVDVVGLAACLAAFVTGGALIGARLRTGPRELPERYGIGDLLVGGVAVHKLSRLVTKSSVASPLRAPFTEFEGPAGSGEHHESPRGTHGLRHGIGELVTCPFCLGVWASSVYVTGLVVAPRPVRAAAAALLVSAVSDGCQHVYARLRSD
jgi:hypothetical protein